MNAYREAPAGAPLVTMLANHLVAIHAETGALLWRQQLERQVSRIVVTAGIVFVAADDEEGYGSTIHMFDLRTGAPTGTIPLLFRCRAVLLSGDRLYFSGGSQIFAVRTDGRPMFTIHKQTMEKIAWGEYNIDLVARDATGAETWRMPSASFNRTATYLSVGDDVAQIDFDG